MKVRPRRVRLGRRVRLRFRVTRVVDGRRYPLAGARIRIGRKSVRTNRRGRARMRYRPRGRPSRRRGRVPKSGLRSVRFYVRVVR